MKKRLLIVLSLLLVFGILLTACAPAAEPVEEEVEEVMEEEAEEVMEEEKVKLVHVVGALGDKSFTDSAYRGLSQAAEEFGFEYVVNEATSDPVKYEQAFRDVAADPDVDIIVVGSPDIIEVLQEVASVTPDKYFIMYDHTIDFEDACSGCDNVYAVQYKQNEGSYLVGLYVGKMSQTGTVGAVGGKEIPVILDFMVGFTQGAKEAGIAEENIIIQYAGSWSDIPKGKELALTMYQQGADYVYQVAGGTGMGVFQAAEEAELWAIGVDLDQAIIIEETDPDQAARIPTSMLKNVDKSLYYAMERFFDDTLPWGTNEALGIPFGVGLAYNKFYDMYTPQDVKDFIAEKEAAVIAGEIDIATVY